MKKLFLIFINCIIILCSITITFAYEEGMAGDIFSDLSLVKKYENSSELRAIEEYSKELQEIISERKQYLNKLYSFFYTGSYNGTFDAIGICNSANLSKGITVDSPLFDNEFYTKYYKLRTEKLLKAYKTTGVVDYEAFYKKGRTEFDSFIKTVFINNKGKNTLIILLQEKLTDKLVEMEPGQRKSFGEEIINLRLTSNNSKTLNLLYEFFESRTRLEFLRDIAEIDRQELIKLTGNVSMTVRSSREAIINVYDKATDGKLDVYKLIDSSTEQAGFNANMYLWELMNEEFTLGFVQEDKSEISIAAEAVLKSIQIDVNGYLVLDIDIVLSELQNEIPEASVNSQLNNSEVKEYKALEALYKAKSKEASAIVRELNRFDIYLELKDQKITNYYTKVFEQNQKLWKKNLDARLNTFGKDGMGDILVYIKRFALLDRNKNKTDNNRILIAKYRNSDIQFKSTQAGMLWIIDMLYKLNINK